MGKLCRSRTAAEIFAPDEVNVQVTHLACNLAKNQYGLEHFEEWVAALRGGDLTSER
jgi:hypothetical protein